MKLPLLVAASALALAACSGQAPRAVTKLDCPATEGDLTRVSVAPDGKTCAYRSADGAEVTLELVAVTGDPATTLKAIEAQLLDERLLPGEQATAQATTADAATAAEAEAAKVLAEAQADAAGEHADIQSPDVEVAQVHLPGIRIVAKDGPGVESANVQIGPVNIDANDNDATVRIFRDVRLKGEAFSREQRGVRATFIYTGKDLPDGYRYVGYQAGGPKTGPLTVAKVRTRDGEQSGDNIRHDVEELVRRNGGV